MEFNENYRYETRLQKKKKQFSIVCLHVKGKTILENDAETYEKETRNYQAFQNIETEFVIK